MTNSKLEWGIMWRFRPYLAWLAVRCQNSQRNFLPTPPFRNKTRCRLHGGLSTGLQIVEGKVRIAAMLIKHGRRSRKFVEMCKKIGAESREVERQMRLDGLI